MPVAADVCSAPLFIPDWKEVYIYRHTHYKQVSCVVVGDENVGKKTLITAFEGAPCRPVVAFGRERLVSLTPLPLFHVPGMVTQKGWKRGQERERCTVSVESLFGVPTMFHLTVLKANRTVTSPAICQFLKQERPATQFVSAATAPDPCSDLMHHLADLLTRTKVDVFLLCVPASGSVEATKSRYTTRHDQRHTAQPHTLT